MQTNDHMMVLVNGSKLYGKTFEDTPHKRKLDQYHAHLTNAANRHDWMANVESVKKINTDPRNTYFKIHDSSDTFKLISGVFGSYSSEKIYMCETLEGMKLCVKNSVYQQRCLEEIKLLNTMDHPNILKLIKAFVETEGSILPKCAMIMSAYMSAMNTFSLLDTNEVLERFTADIFPAVRYIHSYGIVHLDLKPGNILITHSRRLVVCDFNLSKKNGDVILAPTGTRGFMAPEMVALAETPGSFILANQCLDYYSLGMTIRRISVIIPHVTGSVEMKKLHRLVYSLIRPVSSPVNRYLPE